MSKLSEMTLAQVYENGAWSYKVHNFINPYEHNDVELKREWERGYNHARAIHFAEMRAGKVGGKE